MDKESGVYLTITDNSFETGGASQLKVLVPMLTTKGKLGMNYVTASTYKDILGYDLSYNSNYYGLAKILEKVSYAYVWRLNQGAKLANAYFMSATSDKESNDDAETFEDITQLDPAPILAVANKTVGNPGTIALKFTPTPLTSTVPNEVPSPTSPQTIVVEDVSQNEEIELYGETIKSGCILYDSSNSNPVAVIMLNHEDELKVYKVVDGTIQTDTITIDKFNIWSDGTNFYNASMEISTEPQGTPEETKDLGNVRQSEYGVTYDTWNIGDTYYDSSYTAITPEGSAGTAVSIAPTYIADDTVQYLTEGKWYMTSDSGATFYEITRLGKSIDQILTSQVTNTDALLELTTLYGNDAFAELKYVPYTKQVPTGMYTNVVNAWYKVASFTSSAIITESSRETNEDIIAALDAATDIPITYIQYVYEYISQINDIGTASWEEDNLTIVLTSQPAKDTYFTIRRIPVSIKDWTISIADYADNQYTVRNTVDISTDPESEIYWEKVDFGDIQMNIAGNIPSNWGAVRDYFTLDNGNNGSNNIVASDIDVNLLETNPCNVIAMNGITNLKVVNKIAAKAKDYFKHTFADAPAYKMYMDLEEWKKNVYNSEYLAIAGRPDEVEIDDAGTKIYVYPSVNYVAILADMLAAYQSLCYTPAGLTYGGISVESLMECDYENYGDELKTNRINWQRSLSRGTVMWEQRTTYALSTDLSYIAPVFIVDGLREQIVSFEEQFNFRYMTPTDLLNQESGLDAILGDFQTKGFVYSYKIEVPSYAEAQKQGRTLTIPIEVAITKDAEVIYINLKLVNAS